MEDREKEKIEEREGRKVKMGRRERERIMVNRWKKEKEKGKDEIGDSGVG